MDEVKIILRPLGGRTSQEFRVFDDSDQAFIRAQEMLQKLRSKSDVVPYHAYEKLMRKLGFNEREAETAFERTGAALNISTFKINYTWFQRYWREVLLILRQWGPLDLAGIRYFLARQADVHLTEDLLKKLFFEMDLMNVIIWENRKDGLRGGYVITEDVGREHFFPDTQGSLTPEFIELYIRFHAIKQSPQLVGVPDSLLDDLFNPFGAFAG